ncbi:conserved protein of unknown function [Tenacibaculum sp. 190524A02b]|uniref:hypothetical protein n=1 Tax=Tenacibaculum vairaonense TaxID=3137860 RepID=UPI0032B2293B
MRCFTDNNKEITKRIKQGKTFLFQGVESEVLEIANQKAKHIRSYVYEVYADVKNKRIHVGYAVPR